MILLVLFVPSFPIRPGDRFRGDTTSHRVLLHPCFVYAACFHPRDPQTAFTAGYDGNVRVWDATAAQVLQVVTVTKGCVNCLCVDPVAKRLFAGDANGMLHELEMTEGPRLAAVRTFSSRIKETRPPENDI